MTTEKKDKCPGTLEEFQQKVFFEFDSMKKAINDIAALNKAVFDLNEASIYTKLSKSQIYKLTMLHKIPHYKPEGKKIYFDKKSLDEWLLRNPQ